MATKKAAKKPAPDLKSATRNILEFVADQVEKSSYDATIFGALGRVTKEDAAVLAEAKKLAVNYIRMGASQ